ncbi:MAG: hypothetical protein JXA97_05855 [Anaerolineales bacterium]|nr:hypothetical protein [Anaerolineales bacterium]
MKRYTTSGKFFTDVISKHPLRATIQTIDGQIEGLVHLHPDYRLSDEINQENPFLAVTDARIIRADGTFTAPFIAVNKEHIIWVIPADDAEAVDHE